MADTDTLVGQVITTGIPGPRLDVATRRALERLAPRGIVLFAHNVEDVDQLCELTAALHALPSQPLIAIDHEGGRVIRLGAPFTPFPAAAIVGRGGPDAAHAVGLAMGRELASVGVDIDYAPVLDVHSKPANPIIGDRAFSSAPDATARLGIAFMRGLLTAGVLPCGKHFPGHGDTDRDSHLELPVVPRDRAALDAIELVPFRAAIAAGIPLLMTAHVLYPALDAEHSATLSDAILRRLLREQLGFRGVVISDDLGMRAVSEHLAAPEAALATLRAGADWLLLCHDLDQSVRVAECLRTALARDELDAGRVAASAARIARLRGAVSIRRTPSISLPVAEHLALADRLRAMV